MNTTSFPLATEAKTIANPGEQATSRLLPWLLVASISSVFIGLIWDISWHMTIGRDTFWTPAHLAIYLGGALPGTACGILAIRTTFFGTDRERARSVNLWGGRAPFGAWVVIWGAMAMITAGPFDDWWHSAYGLDVKIISPPHVLLFSGVFSVVLGTMLFLVRDINVTDESRTTNKLFVFASGILLGLVAYLFLSEGWPNRQHSAAFYSVCCWAFPGLLLIGARVSRLRWGATWCALTYMGIVAGMAWILPLFPAQAKLGPVWNPVDHMVPPYFPHLLIVPAFLIDLCHHALGRVEERRRIWFLAAIVALVFPAVFIATQWNLSSFLLSPAGRNAIFLGGRSVPYYSQVTDHRFVFWEPFDLFQPSSLLRIWIAAALSSLAGAIVTQWMRRVVR